MILFRVTMTGPDAYQDYLAMAELAHKIGVAVEGEQNGVLFIAYPNDTPATLSASYASLIHRSRVVSTKVKC